MKDSIYKNFKARHKTLSFFGRSQYRDWRMILSVFFSLFVLAIILALISYNITRNENNYMGERSATSSDNGINKEVLTSVITKMEEREKNFEKLKNSKPVISDPSM